LAYIAKTDEHISSLLIRLHVPGLHSAYAKISA
jgi:hypothetical protein